MSSSPHLWSTGGYHNPYPHHGPKVCHAAEDGAFLGEPRDTEGGGDASPSDTASPPPPSYDELDECAYCGREGLCPNCEAQSPLCYVCCARSDDPCDDCADAFRFNDDERSER